MIPSQRIIIIGAGMVGSSIAYSLVNQGIGKGVYFIDINQDLAKAHSLDLEDASGFVHGTEINYINYADLENGDIVVIAGGASQKEGQTRLDLLQINTKIIRSMLLEIKKTQKKVYLLMVTNPVDVLTYIAAKESGLDQQYVFGSGTYLDTMRLRSELASIIDVNTDNIHAYILGEHGDSSFPALSGATVSSTPLLSFISKSSSYAEELQESVRMKAYEIIKGKHATYFGIGTAISRICRAILRDEKRIIPLSVLFNGEYGQNNVAASVPVKISADGVKLIHEIPLTNEEHLKFTNSINVIKEAINEVTP